MIKDYYLDHPVIDRVMKVVIALARETYVMHDRMALVEKKLNEKGVLTRADIEDFAPTAADQVEIDKRRDAFIANILGPITKDRPDE
ncbi:MAG: hypothetical protein FJX59_15905 [Alphaproteobacteria bacterium]|nr:hypothetical protein [Alphaproteobacteria bacterium]